MKLTLDQLCAGDYKIPLSGKSFIYAKVFDSYNMSYSYQGFLIDLLKPMQPKSNMFNFCVDESKIEKNYGDSEFYDSYDDNFEDTDIDFIRENLFEYVELLYGDISKTYFSIEGNGNNDTILNSFNYDLIFIGEYSFSNDDYKNLLKQSVDLVTIFDSTMKKESKLLEQLNFASNWYFDNYVEENANSYDFSDEICLIESGEIIGLLNDNVYPMIDEFNNGRFRNYLMMKNELSALGFIIDKNIPKQIEQLCAVIELNKIKPRTEEYEEIISSYIKKCDLLFKQDYLELTKLQNKIDSLEIKLKKN
jgi:hypothetical protein